MRFKRIDTWLLLGGGELLGRFARFLIGSRRRVVIVTSLRHAREPLEEEDFETVCRRMKAEVIVTEQVDSDRAVLDIISPSTLGLSFGAAWIMKRDFIERFSVGHLLNVHPTPLPEYRGGGGFSWQIMMNDRRGCSLLHLVDEGIDTGPILKRRLFRFPPKCRIPEDYERHYIRRTETFLQAFVRDVGEGKPFTLIEQVERRSTYWPRLATKIHGFVDWRWPLAGIERFICAFDSPYPGASTFVNGRRVFLHDVRATAGQGFHPFQNGLVFRIEAGRLWVAHQEGTLLIGRLVDEEGRDISPSVRPGDRLHTPESFLEEANASRIIYTANGMKVKSR